MARKPSKSDLSNVRISYYRDYDNGFSEEYIIDGYVDKEGATIIDIFRMEESKWTESTNDLSDDELDQVTEQMLTKYNDNVESESTGNETDLADLTDFSYLDGD
jgi:hypothetical protein